jgi:hypothetical protein
MVDMNSENAGCWPGIFMFNREVARAQGLSSRPRAFAVKFYEPRILHS